jgi:hypothetical protein
MTAEMNGSSLIMNTQIIPGQSKRLRQLMLFGQMVWTQINPLTHVAAG